IRKAKGRNWTFCFSLLSKWWFEALNSPFLVCAHISRSLLTDPNPASPANPKAAQLYQHDIQAYNKFMEYQLWNSSMDVDSSLGLSLCL
ncbi:hypothetical protein TorRG33x02_119660, partial [Trema orientale]